MVKPKQITKATEQMKTKLSGFLDRSWFKIILLMVAYYSLMRLFMHATFLQEADYHQSFIWVRLFSLDNFTLFMVLLFVLIPFFYLRKLGLKWQDLPGGNQLLLFVGLVAGILAWTFSSYDYNLYYGFSHWADRLLILLFFGMLLWKPIAVFPLVLVILAVMGQFHYPIGGYSTADTMPLVRMLIAFLAMLLLQVVVKRNFTAALFVVILCIQASGYWISGNGKFNQEWFFYDNIYYLLPATYSTGWLSFLTSETISQLTASLAIINWPMKISTLVLEAGAIIVLLRRKLTLALLIGWIGFHCAVFAISGILFWRWMLIEACLLYILLKYSERESFDIFYTSNFILSVVLIIGASYWFKPVQLAWFDSKINYVYRFEGVGESGKTYDLSAQFFAPYEYQFTQAPFAFLSREKQLNLVWGATGRKTARALRNVTTTDGVLALEEERGGVFYNEKKIERLQSFIQAFLGNLNSSRSKRTWWKPIQAPTLLQSSRRGQAYDGKEEIVEVVAYQVTTLFDEKNYIELRKRELRRIKI